MGQQKYTEAKKQGNQKWDSKNLDRISVALPKGSKDALKAKAERGGESVNAFIKRAIEEMAETENMHRAYQRALLRQLTKMEEALARGDQKELQKILSGLVEDTKSDIGDCPSVFSP